MTIAINTYERHKDANRRNMAEHSRRGRNIGEIPPVAEPARRRDAASRFRLFCEVYFPQTFNLGWSDDHLEVMEKIEQSVLRGGLFAMAMPRGSGKTSLCECASMWAMLNGHRDFVSLIGADMEKAGGMLESVKTDLESNELLEADYPEVCIPIAKLEGIANRCGGQHYNDERTHIGWTKKELILPTLKPEGWADIPELRDFTREGGYSLASGAIMKVAGITGGIRGMKHKKADGAAVRPSLVILDDPQTDQSARSPSQCQTRERILAGAILGLAGPGKKIAGIMPCTVVSPGDMADRILDNDKHPRWNGKRTKMVYAFPANEKLWEQYAEIRKGQGPGQGPAAATAFYAANREEMDRGSRVAWEDRHNEDELSAIQHAMNLKIDDERSFWAEYQNQPLPEDEVGEDDLTPDRIAAKLNRLGRREIPTSCDHLTAFIDVQGSVLWYAVAAWEPDFGGYLVDYGTFPDQKVPYFTLRGAKRTLEKEIKGAGLEGQIYGGLERLTELILGREWLRDDGATLKIERCLIDANWGTSTLVVKKFCRQSVFASVLTPSHGTFVGASRAPMAEWPPRPGDKAGHNWRLRRTGEERGIRSVVFDANYWKSFVHARLSTAMGDRGCLSIFGKSAEEHRLLADHLCSEYRVPVEGRGRKVDEWKQKPDHPDNHWLDCLVGSAVAASMCGVALAETSKTVGAGGTKKVSFKELQERKRRA